MKLSDLFLQGIQVLSPAILAGLGYLSLLLSKFIKARVKNEYLAGLLGRLNMAVFDAVKAVEQSIVDELKKANTDGVITPEERQLVKQAAIQAVKSHLGIKGLGELAKILGLSDSQVEGMISDKIEAAVHDLKKTPMI